MPGIVLRHTAGLAALAAGLALTAAASATPGDTPAIHRYVALGDSGASVGSRDLLQPGSPAYCLRAQDNYPSVLARMLSVGEFIDASCSGAKTTHMTEPQYGRDAGPNPAQFDSLTPGTDLVTLTLGANDVGVFNVNVINAAQLDTVRRNVGAALDGIRARAPHATIVLTTYLRYFPEGGGCYGFTDQGGQQRLTDALRETARAHAALFADNFRITGHDMCRPAGVHWVNGPTPDTASVPLHANVAGQEYLAEVIAATLLR
ncbi:SGNH/GDSL hydrolase family protein [Nocardia huaxiensis]|uniref:SGNH/GDSL hydrolase family protein n=1 Tax=Nocardia huaxiensis TaxID=2755382 RepID=A0A7D6ZK14_9NOCA|nr:SGNH/GDSL hydrolase family protein [Nocardia huaxiensis]QLY29523.1 SGNH/GDSL hydrolase family protein [Nocardia huaxiensis]UFS96919.1 SGNH/GDSL hydrolase family protein [Nocardia huaxiensis]